jgi:hypothetical protein
LPPQLRSKLAQTTPHSICAFTGPVEALARRAPARLIPHQATSSALPADVARQLRQPLACIRLRANAEVILIAPASSRTTHHRSTSRCQAELLGPPSASWRMPTSRQRSAAQLSLPSCTHLVVRVTRRTFSPRTIIGPLPSPLQSSPTAPAAPRRVATSYDSHISKSRPSAPAATTAFLHPPAEKKLISMGMAVQLPWSELLPHRHPRRQREQLIRLPAAPPLLVNQEARQVAAVPLQQRSPFCIRLRNHSTL